MVARIVSRVVVVLIVGGIRRALSWLAATWRASAP